MLKGRRRVETDRFVALRSHYLFESQFTTPGIEGAHEKGGVEGEVGRFRRNHLVPVPSVRDLAELNALLLAGCEADLAPADRRAAGDGRGGVGGGAAAAARAAGRARSTRARRPRRGWTRSRWSRSARTATRSRSRWPGCGSAPGSAPARSRSATAAGRSPATSGCTAGSAPAPSSTTTSSCSQRKPGGLEHSLALRQERERGGWPGCFDELWAALTDRYGRSEAARQMVDVLLLCREHGPGRRRARRPRRARRRRARRPRRRGARPPRAEHRQRRAGAARPARRRAWPAHAPARAGPRPTTTS